MPVIVYRSTDASAPVLTGAVGSLVSLLDACLVVGYGAKAAAGWTKPYTGTNTAVFRNSAATGTGMYLNVNDAASSTGGAKEAHMTGYQTMSAVATGTGQFPTSAILNLGTAPAGSVVCRKSTTADATARPWILAADAKRFYLFIETGDQLNPTTASGFFFGDIISYATSDPYCCAIIGRNSANSTSGGLEQLQYLCGSNSDMSATVAGHFLASTVAGVGTSISFGKHTDVYKAGTGASTPVASGATANGNGVAGLATVSATNLTYPNTSDGGLYLAPAWVHHQGVLRGYLPGYWVPCQARPIQPGDTIAGTGTLAGKTFEGIAINSAQSAGPSPAGYGLLMLEISDTWS